MPEKLYFPTASAFLFLVFLRWRLVVPGKFVAAKLTADGPDSRFGNRDLVIEDFDIFPVSLAASVGMFTDESLVIGGRNRVESP
jgi:hypothetical protein